jgi:hypothetical protein
MACCRAGELPAQLRGEVAAGQLVVQNLSAITSVQYAVANASYRDDDIPPSAVDVKGITDAVAHAEAIPSPSKQVCAGFMLRAVIHSYVCSMPCDGIMMPLCSQLQLWLQVGRAVRDMRTAFVGGDLRALQVAIEVCRGDGVVSHTLERAAGDEVRAFFSFLESRQVRVGGHCARCVDVSASNTMLHAVVHRRS